MEQETGLDELIQQAKALQENMQRIQDKLEKTAVIGEAGAGLVKVDITCKYETRNVSIDLMRIFIEEGFFKILQEKGKDPQEMTAAVRKFIEKVTPMLCALVAGAFNDSARKIEGIVQREVSNMTQMVPPPTGTGGPAGFAASAA